MQRQNNQVMLNLGTGATGEARSAAAQETEIGTAKACLERPAAAGPSRRALEQVRRNKGAPGADGMTVDALASHLKKHWPAIRAQLLDGTYQPQPVRRVKGIVFAGTGAGILTDFQKEEIKTILSSPSEPKPVLVRSSRTGNGRVIGRKEYDDLKFIPADTLNPQKSRILLMLALTRTNDLSEIRRMFSEY
jgi:hypothetical protein